jgi:hypothetical protein
MPTVKTGKMGEKEAVVRKVDLHISTCDSWGSRNRHEHQVLSAEEMMEMISLWGRGAFLPKGFAQW